VRQPLTHPLRQALAALLAGLVMLLSAAPCTAFAAPTAGPASVSAPADPCLARHAAPCEACAQFACQHAAHLGSAAEGRIDAPSAVAFALGMRSGSGRTDAPPLPPPRLL